MCNPTQSPTKASASSQSHSSSRNLPPPSPASTNANPRMLSSAAPVVASPASRNTTEPNTSNSSSSANCIASNNNNNNNAVAPILKLVTSLRNSEDRSIRSSPSRDAAGAAVNNNTTTSNSSPLRRIIVRRPGQEPRDYSQSDLLGNHSTPPPGQFRPIQAQHRDDDVENEIPSLIDEDSYGRYNSPVDVAFVNENHHRDNDDGAAFGHSIYNQRRDHSPPKQQQQQQQQQQPRSVVQETSPKVKTDCTGKAAMPFFVLDWMLEDLVPDHQNAQDLANLLKEQESQRASSFSPLRKSKSCGIVGLNMNAITRSINNSKSNAAFGSNKAASPILQRLLPWSKVASEPRKPTRPVHIYRPATPPTKDTGIPPMPTTPKSSNRKNSKQRQKERRESLRIEEAISKGGQAAVVATGAHDDMALLVPRNLSDSLEDAKALNKGSLPAPSPLRKFMPRVTSSPPVQAPSNICPEDSWVKNSNHNSSNMAATKKSASCPQFCQDSPELRQRAKEQHDRRERRNKLTVVQRSLTLAQGWNNKGLSMAGNATRAEQYHHHHNENDETAQQQQQTALEHWWESSLECWDNALEIYRSLLGEYHERVADVQNNRGIALGKLGRFDEALLALGMALEARKKQEQRSKNNNNSSSSSNSSPSKQQELPPSEMYSAPASAATVSTLHNIANVFRDAGNPTEALRALVEAQARLKNSEVVSKEGSFSLYHRHHCWHQSARLSTAIGHVYYESKSWRDARDSYGQALEVYERLGRSLSRQSETLGWGKQTPLLSTGDPNEAKRLELLHHQQLIQREVAVLEKDLNELDRSQQAKDGSRARLLQARKQQQQQQQKTLFGIVSSLRA